MDSADERRKDDETRRWKLLQRMELARTNQNTVVWTIVSIFAAGNAVLLAAFVDASVASPPHRWLTWSVALAGVVAAGFSGVLVDRAIRFLDVHERVIAELEQDLRLAGKYRLHHAIETTAYDAVMNGSLGAKRTLRLFSIALVAAWSAAAILVAFRLWPAPPEIVVVSSCLLAGLAFGAVVAVNAAA